MRDKTVLLFCRDPPLLIFLSASRDVVQMIYWKLREHNLQVSSVRMRVMFNRRCHQEFCVANSPSSVWPGATPQFPTSSNLIFVLASFLYLSFPSFSYLSFASFSYLSSQHQPEPPAAQSQLGLHLQTLIFGFDCICRTLLIYFFTVGLHKNPLIIGCHERTL